MKRTASAYLTRVGREITPPEIGCLETREQCSPSRGGRVMMEACDSVTGRRNNLGIQCVRGSHLQCTKGVLGATDFPLQS
jgi:hypothetical protein